MANQAALSSLADETAVKLILISSYNMNELLNLYSLIQIILMNVSDISSVSGTRESWIRRDSGRSMRTQ